MWQRNIASRVFILAVANLALIAAASAAQIETGPIDNVAFQALVDAAAARDTIVCGPGVYSFNGPVRIVKPLTIIAADPEDPPIFEGTGDLTYSDPWHGNNGFVVWGPEADIRGLRFSGLQFRDFRRGLVFLPEWSDADCVIPDAGTLSRLTIDNCRFSNCRNAINIFSGRVQNFEVRDCEIVDVVVGILAWDGAFYDYCVEDIVLTDGLRHGRISGNHIEARNALNLVGPGQLHISHNDMYPSSVFGGGIAVFFSDDTAYYFPDFGPVPNLGVFVNNTITGFFAAVDAYGPTPMQVGPTFANNVISDCFFGIAVEWGGNHCLITSNTTTNNVFDYYLVGVPPDDPFAWMPPPSYENHVIADFDDTVVDFGVNNRIDGPYNLIENPHVPQWVKDKLAALHAEMAANRRP